MSLSGWESSLFNATFVITNCILNKTLAFAGLLNLFFFFFFLPGNNLCRHVNTKWHSCTCLKSAHLCGTTKVMEINRERLACTAFMMRKT